MRPVEGQHSLFVLRVSVSLSSAEVRWREFFMLLPTRSLHGVDLISSDAHAGMTEARKDCFTGGPWQRCEFHMLERLYREIKGRTRVATLIPQRGLPVTIGSRAATGAKRRMGDRKTLPEVLTS